MTQSRMKWPQHKLNESQTRMQIKTYSSECTEENNFKHKKINHKKKKNTHTTLSKQKERLTLKQKAPPIYLGGPWILELLTFLNFLRARLDVGPTKVWEVNSKF